MATVPASFQVTLAAVSALPRKRVPSLMLQTLVENAVKHGVAPAIEGGRVVVRAAAAAAAPGWTEIQVENSGRRLGDADPRRGAGTGTGLVNVRHRLDLLYGDGHGFAIGSLPDGRTQVCFRVGPQGVGDV